MIRYPVTEAFLHNEIDAISGTWRTRAAARTATLVAAGRYSDGPPDWSDVKPAYMRAQHFKCVFCERKLETRHGKIDFVVEHFRPKGSVEPWPGRGRGPSTPYPFPMGAASPLGYYWLAYEPWNYAASCKACNSSLKANFFPVAGPRLGAPATIAQLAQEQAYLCYPLGTADADPASLIRFEATTAVPAAAGGFERRRGEVIIDFFELNIRDSLHFDRAMMIVVFGGALRAIADGNATASDIALAGRITAPEYPHSNCLRSFNAAWQADPATGRRIYEKCQQIVADMDL